MSNLEQLEDNMSFMRSFKPLEAWEYEAIERARHAIEQVESIPCTACRYCTAGCPQHIPIPEIFAARNEQLIWSADERGKRDYERAVSAEGAGRASACIACGQCEGACPQNLPIIDLLAECATALE